MQIANLNKTQLTGQLVRCVGEKEDDERKRRINRQRTDRRTDITNPNKEINERIHRRTDMINHC